jgi:hypothetical protein
MRGRVPQATVYGVLGVHVGYTELGAYRHSSITRYNALLANSQRLLSRLRIYHTGLGC